MPSQLLHIINQAFIIIPFLCVRLFPAAPQVGGCPQPSQAPRCVHPAQAAASALHGGWMLLLPRAGAPSGWELVQLGGHRKG